MLFAQPDSLQINDLYNRSSGELNFSAFGELGLILNGHYWPKGGFNLLRILTPVHVVSHSGDFVGYRPAAKRALLGPFSGKAGFISSAILRRHQRRVLLSTLSMSCDSRLWSLRLRRCLGFCKSLAGEAYVCQVSQ